MAEAISAKRGMVGERIQLPSSRNWWAPDNLVVAVDAQPERSDFVDVPVHLGLVPLSVPRVGHVLVREFLGR